MPAVASGFVSQAEYGRHRKVSRKTVTDWKAKGLLVLDGNGQIDVEKTDAVLDERPANYRGGVTSNAPKRGKGNKSTGKRDRVTPPRAFAPPPSDDADDIDAPPIDLTDLGIEDAGNWKLAEATRVKEIYLALKRRLEYLVAEGELVPIQDVITKVEAEYTVVREALMGIPGKIAASLVGLDRAAIQAKITDEISEALRELNDPDPERSGGDGGQSREPPSPGEADAPAAAAP